MLARRLASILPPLDRAAAIEVTAIHSFDCEANSDEHRPTWPQKIRDGTTRAARPSSWVCGGFW
jgi:predicted ATPase with chaperone activity